MHDRLLTPLLTGAELAALSQAVACYEKSKAPPRRKRRARRAFEKVTKDNQSPYVDQ